MITTGRRRQAVPDYLRQRWGMHVTSATMANLAVTGAGPVYRLVGKYAVYADEDLDSWAQSRITSPRRKASGDHTDEVVLSGANSDDNPETLQRDSVGTAGRTPNST